MEQEVGRFQTEIILFVILAACVILMASNFGAGGFVGDAISNFCFGLMGLMAYLFPIVFFLESAFILINKTNRLAYKKLAAASCPERSTANLRPLWRAFRASVSCSSSKRKP